MQLQLVLVVVPEKGGGSGCGTGCHAIFGRSGSSGGADGVLLIPFYIIFIHIPFHVHIHICIHIDPMNIRPIKPTIPIPIEIMGHGIQLTPTTQEQQTQHEHGHGRGAILKEGRAGQREEFVIVVPVVSTAVLVVVMALVVSSRMLVGVPIAIVRRQDGREGSFLVGRRTPAIVVDDVACGVPPRGSLGVVVPLAGVVLAEVPGGMGVRASVARRGGRRMGFARFGWPAVTVVWILGRGRGGHGVCGRSVGDERWWWCDRCVVPTSWETQVRL